MCIYNEAVNCTFNGFHSASGIVDAAMSSATFLTPVSNTDPLRNISETLAPINAERAQYILRITFVHFEIKLSLRLSCFLGVSQSFFAGFSDQIVIIWGRLCDIEPDVCLNLAFSYVHES